MWPNSGYWSESELLPPAACSVSSACPGSNGQSSEYPVLVNPDGSRITSQCSADEGYTGEFCSQCDDTHFQDQGLCSTCFADAQDKAQFISMMFAAGVLITLLAVFFVFTPDQYLWIGVSLILLTQSTVSVAQTAVAKLSTTNSTISGFANFIRTLSLINWDLSCMKLGCTVPRISYSTLYFATLLAISVAAVIFSAASLLYAYWKADAKGSSASVDSNSQLRIAKRMSPIQSKSRNDNKHNVAVAPVLVSDSVISTGSAWITLNADNTSRD